MQSSTVVSDFDWAVIGAGPAGIAAVGKLLDAQVDPNKIAWIDPFFKVGDLGLKWYNVSSNTKVSLFNKFLLYCKSFEMDRSFDKFPLSKLNPEDTCLLSYISSPLQYVTEILRKKVHQHACSVQEIEPYKDIWKVQCKAKQFTSKKIILAIGSEAKSLDYPKSTLSLEIAMNPDLLHEKVSSEDVVGVFGSSHSAVVTMYNLIDANVKKVVNFYKSPLKYAQYFDDWILYDNTGLKGYSAIWAKKNLDVKIHPSIERVHVQSNAFADYLSQCSKVIYAVGFDRRKSIKIGSINLDSYDKTKGIIAPCLYGVGIAFPEGSFDKAGNYEYRVGLWKFMDFLDKVMPDWLKDS
ncbi:MAG: pyridine nucleotide-disulfide oxidoreductase [Chlamydiota bacterium]